MAWRRVLAACGVLLIASLGAGAGTLTGRAGPFRLLVAVDPDPPVVGDNTVSVTVTDAAEQPVEGATVTVTASMTDMNMGATPFEATAGATAGTYQSQVNLSMAGGWALDIKVAANGSEGHQAFKIVTGNPVHQAAVGGRRAVWLWLLVMIGAPLLVSLLPERVIRRDRRGTLAGILLLIAAVFFARAIVETYKRPGQMGVIESQAMDMTAMKPPVGTVPVVVETVGYGEFESSVSYTGSVVPYTQQDVYPRVTGMIVDMPVYPGDRVLAGQVIVRLDTRELSSKQSEAVMAHLAAQDAAGAARQEARSAAAGVDQARSEAAMAEQRIKRMLAERISSEAMVRRSQQELAAAQARLRQAEAQVEAAQAAQRTKAAMSDEGRAMVGAAVAERGGAGSMITEATEERTAARSEVAEAERMVEAAQARRERAEANAAAMRAELPRAEADVAEMQADLAFAEVQLQRMAALLDEGAVSQEEYDEQLSMRDQAAARVAQAKAMVQNTRQKIASEEAMVREADADEGAARERRTGAQAMVRAAAARIAQAESGLEGSGAMVTQREAGVRSRAAEEDEAAKMVAMRRAEVETMRADIKSAEAAIEQARQEVAKADAGVAEMRAERDRATAMIRERSSMATAALQRAAEMANRTGQARAAAFTAETIAGYTEIRATVDGVVTERVTSPSTLVQPGMVLLRIAQIDQVRLQANVAQTDAGAIQIGAPVRVTPRKDPARTDRSVVSAVFPSSSPGSRTQIVESIIDNSDSYYLPGDFVTLSLGTGAKVGDSISVPSQAVVQITETGGAVIGSTRPAVWVVSMAAAADGGATKTEYYCTMHPEVISDEAGICPKCKMDLVPRLVPADGAAEGGHEGHDKPVEQAAPAEAETEYYCTMHPEVVSDEPGLCPKCKMDLVPRETATAGSEGGIARRVPVTLGRRSGDRVEVLEGLKPGDQVIVRGAENLREGDRVTITAEQDETVPALGGAAASPGTTMSQGDAGRDRAPTGPAGRVQAPSPGRPSTPRSAAPPKQPAPRAERRPVPRAEAPPPAKEVYTCPMHPEVVSDKPGSCPKCGMDLVLKGR